MPGGSIARREVVEVAVVGKYPVAAPQLAHKGVAVFKRDPALRGLADVRDDVAAFDWVAADELGLWRLAGGLVVNEMAQAFVTCRPGLAHFVLAFEKGNAPAIGVQVGVSAALRKSGEAESHIGRGVAVHAKQLAHVATSRLSCEALTTGARP